MFTEGIKLKGGHECGSYSGMTGVLLKGSLDTQINAEKAQREGWRAMPLAHRGRGGSPPGASRSQVKAL